MNHAEDYVERVTELERKLNRHEYYMMIMIGLMLIVVILTR